MEQGKAGRGRIYSSITETIGDTPLVRPTGWQKEKGVKATLLAKLEFFNPIASVKDRIGVNMIAAMEAAEDRPGKIDAGGADFGQYRHCVGVRRGRAGYRLILVMPETMSIERRKMLCAARRGARTDAGAAGHEGRDCEGRGTGEDDPRRDHPAAVRKSGEPGNPSEDHCRGNLERHRRQVDIVISGVGTGGTITGVGQVLKPRRSPA